ncbi:MAG: helix-turn-helix domain-containing protein [Lachnospiraceae bacterium]|jgi:carbohydrate diacid regulator|nr:helix-turn-helix domain-containing protein [Lachnospiraceae bacterium]MCI1334356.1 helix-turn-helix domain-containing protein [Lachnospiraceae bacterium]MCI1378774.1 helix-turn-helix domain-containing protein [Lachnospiraceae bacterium]
MAEISERTAQQIVDTVKDVCGYHINFIRPDGVILASTNPERVGTYHEIGHKAAQTGQPIEVGSNDSFYGTQQGVNLPFFYHGEVLAVIGITGDPEEVRKYAYLAQRITGLLLKEQEYDARSRNAGAEIHYFVRSLVRAEAVNHDFYLDFLETHGIDESLKYMTVIVRLDRRYNPANLSMIEQEILSAFRQTESPLYTFEYPNEYILILREEVYRSWEYRFRRIAEKYGQFLKVGAGMKHSLIHQNRSYAEADIAVRAAGTRGGYAEYSSLHLEILLASVPESVRRQYAEKTAGKLGDKDRQMLETYFACDCSLKEAAGRLFVHKNTLQYHLDRIRTVTGFDPRKFSDAVVLYLALREEMSSSATDI